jgi:hypothetical protein
MVGRQIFIMIVYILAGLHVAQANQKRKRYFQPRPLAASILVLNPEDGSRVRYGLTGRLLEYIDRLGNVRSLDEREQAAPPFQPPQTVAAGPDGLPPLGGPFTGLSRGDAPQRAAFTVPLFGVPHFRADLGDVHQEVDNSVRQFAARQGPDETGEVSREADISGQQFGAPQGPDERSAGPLRAQDYLGIGWMLEGSENNPAPGPFPPITDIPGPPGPPRLPAYELR